MHSVIDVLAALILLFFLLAGWHKGFLLSVLGVGRVFLAYGAAFFAGRYLGFWLGEVAHRPRIVTIPVVAGLAFIVIYFIFHLIIATLRSRLQHKEEEGYHHPWYSALSGSGINGFIGLFFLIFVFWLGDLFLVGMTGQSIPGTDRSKTGQITRRVTYETVNLMVSRKGYESQANAVARIISNPTRGMAHLENLISADSVQRVLSDKQLANDVLSGNQRRIEQNPSLQKLFDDKKTLHELKEMGLLTGHEKKSALCEKLSRFGRNENIRMSIQNLTAKGLLSTDQITLLIRDPDFDVIVGELIK